MKSITPAEYRGAQSEAEFQRAVIDLARLRGWLVFHARPARTQSGRWSTPMQGNPGFPDLVMTRGGRVIFAELKAERGRVSRAQQAWLDALSNDTVREPHTWTHFAFMWRPSDWQQIEEALQ